MNLPRRLALAALAFATVFGLVFATFTPREAVAAPGPACVEGTQRSGAIYRICVPKDWNRKLVVYAHGFVAPQEPVAIPEGQLELGDVSLPGVVNGLGYAFATTSYSKNGLAILEGVEDLTDLVRIFERRFGDPAQTFLVGGSEGGLITALAIEREPQTFDAGLAACGPVGDFRKQIDYLGDVRVVFDYYFPGLIPGSPLDVPDEVIEDWDSVYEPEIIDALNAAPDKLSRIQRIVGMPRQLSESNAEAVAEVLWYNVFATEDTIDTLGGNPFDNTTRVYRGSENDTLLNANVERFAADSAALREMRKYQTMGKLSRPLVTLHTTRDPVVPYWHEDLYRAKVRPSYLHRNLPAYRDGHCGFEIADALGAFALLQLMVGPVWLDRPDTGVFLRD